MKSYIEDTLATALSRQDAVKKFMNEAVLAEIERIDRAEFLKKVKAKIDEPPQARGIIARAVGAFV